jgi:serine O-acetyltransferase
VAAKTDSWRTVFDADLAALGLPGWRWRYVLTHRIAYYQRLLRRAEHQRSQSGLRRLAFYVTRLRLAFLAERLGVDIPLGVFGPGLAIVHAGGIVVSDMARVGARCRLHQNVTIGSVRDGAPALEDDVFLGAGAGVYGGITVGSGAKIGPLALVNQDVPAGAVVVANRGTMLEKRTRAAA